MPYVLLVEEQHSLADSLVNHLSQRNGISVRVAHSFRDAYSLVKKEHGAFSCAVYDLDTSDFEAEGLLDVIVNSGIPSIAITKDYDEKIKDSVLSLQFIDHFLKQNLNEIDQVAALVAQVHSNRDIRVLLVDSSSSFQTYLTQLLRRYQFQVFTASTGNQALQWVDSRQSKPMDIIVVDYGIDDNRGCQLVSQLRIRLHQNEVAIIGVADRDKPTDAVAMFKAGANDFIGKPFLQEEFACRVGQMVERLRHSRTVQSLATRDYLTQLHNRRYLVEIGEVLHAAAIRKNVNLQCFFVDIDYFGEINAQQGYHFGDIILKQFAKLLAEDFRTCDIVTRYSGEEFCILTLGLSREQLAQYRRRLIDHVAEQFFGPEFEQVQLSVSVGYTDELGQNFSEFLNHAYQQLMLAKQHRGSAALDSSNLSSSS